MKKNKLIIGGLFLFLICLSTFIFQYAFKTNVKADENNQKNIKSFVVNKQIQVGNHKYNFQGNISYEYVTGLEIDDIESKDIRIMDFYADEDYIKVGETKTVTFTANILSDEIIEGQKIELYGNDEFVGYLYDNGQGIDTQENDGKFVGAFDLYSDKRSHTNYYIVCDNVSSKKIDVTFSKPYTDEEWKVYEDFSAGIDKIRNSHPETGNTDKDTESAIQSFNEIKAYLDEQIIVGNVIRYNINDWGISVKLSNGMGFPIPIDFLLSFNTTDSNNKIMTKSRKLALQKANSSQIITLQPFYDDPNNSQNHTDILDKAATKLANSEYGYTFSKNLDNKQVTINELKNLDKYRVIILSSHGGYFENYNYGTSSKDVYTGYILLISININGDNLEEYQDAIDSGEIIPFGKNQTLVTERFFENNYKVGSFDNSLIYWGTCHGADSSSLANIFISKGATTFLSYENSVSTLYLNNMCETIFDELLKTKDDDLTTIGQAVGVAKAKYGSNDQESWAAKVANLIGLVNREPATLKVFGNSNFRLNSSFINGTSTTLKDNGNISSDIWATVWTTDRNYSNTAFKGANGTFSCLVPSGTYKMEVSAYGYKPRIIENIEVEKNQTKYLSNSYLISKEEEKGDIGGIVKNAINGSKINNATIKLRKNHGVSSGEYVKDNNGEDIEIISDDTGKYFLGDLEAGYYTAEIMKDGFITGYENVYVGNSENNSEFSTTSQDLIISPSLSEDEYRIVLTWGENPSDLDSHFTGKLSSGSDFHVYFSHKTQYDGDICIANLDMDDTSGYGPETITINLTNNNKFNYYVYKYSGIGTLSTSEAQVKLYKGNDLLTTYNVPTEQGNGNYWNVFSIDKGNIVGINTITTSPAAN